MPQTLPKSKARSKPKAASKASRSTRIDLRTSPEVKSLIERAALLRHTSVSAYLLDSALQRAKDDLNQTESILLQAADRDLFFAALANPPAPNQALRALLASQD